MTQSEVITRAILQNCQQNLAALACISYECRVAVTGKIGETNEGSDACQAVVRRDGNRAEIIGDYRSCDSEGKEYPQSY